MVPTANVVADTLPATGGYYINTGNIVPTPTVVPTPGVLPTTGGYYINTGNLVPTTNVVPTPGGLPTTGGYYINTGDLTPVTPVTPNVVPNTGGLPTTGGYYIDTSTLIPNTAQQFAATPVISGPAASPYTMTGGVYGMNPMAMQTGISDSTKKEAGSCDSTCATCAGPGSDQCLTCVQGKYPQRLEGKTTFVCLPNKSS
eukprot:TRINITY_DN8372_c0_g1_i20.p1 TRINITY_DN8372_c0_g1~~TRINITY_DN8372_c0_g1_i20.p1  ORF type:complete len:200 (-),score=10.85 TRINITY_DN8372_c0_g1_i20:85-684(-)